MWTYLLSGLIVWFCSWLLLFTHASIPPAVAGTVVAQVNVHTCTHEHTARPGVYGMARPHTACAAGGACDGQLGTALFDPIATSDRNNVGVSLYGD